MGEAYVLVSVVHTYRYVLLKNITLGSDSELEGKPIVLLI